MFLASEHLHGSSHMRCQFNECSMRAWTVGWGSNQGAQRELAPRPLASASKRATCLLLRGLLPLATPSSVSASATECRGQVSEANHVPWRKCGTVGGRPIPLGKRLPLLRQPLSPIGWLNAIAGGKALVARSLACMAYVRENPVCMSRLVVCGLQSRERCCQR